MGIIKNSFLFVVFIFISIQIQAIIPERAGWWKFDDPLNLTKAEAGFGSDLVLVGIHSSEAGPEAGNGATFIGKGSYYQMQHSISPNGGGVFVNEYSLQYDFKIPVNNV